MEFTRYVGILHQMRRIPMLHVIKTDYRNPEEDKINFNIINRVYEKDLVSYLIDCFMSISTVLPEIEMIDHSFIIDVDKVSQSDYERTRSNRIKDQNKRYAYIKDSRLGELRMRFRVDMEFNGEHEELFYNVKMLVPVPDADGYYNLKGIRYILQYQLTESDTYTTSSELVMASIMPIKIKKLKMFAEDTTGTEYRLNYYRIDIFNKYEDFIYFYFATMGFRNTLVYFSVDRYIKAVEVEDNDPNYVYFKISNTLTIKVKRRAMQSDYVQSILGSILIVLTNRMGISDIVDRSMWIKKIGAFKLNVKKESYYELGCRYIILFNRMLDESTKYSMRLTDHNSRDIYAIVRWLIQNYNELWEKNNLDLMTKRLRCNELVASLINGTISDRIKRFVNNIVNTREKMETKYNNFFSYRGNEIISQLHKSGLLNNDDIVNDMDFFQKLKVTQSGNNKSGVTVTSARRSLHPSQLGKLDINVCSSNDPGLTNYITPLCETDGMHFKGAPPEPESFYSRLLQEVGDPSIDGDGCPILILDPVKFNDVLDCIEVSSVTVLEKGEE